MVHEIRKMIPHVIKLPWLKFEYERINLIQ